MKELNYNEMNYIISEASKRLINEINVNDAQERFYKDIPENDFRSIVYLIQDDNDVLLPDTKWALNLYKRKSPNFMEDLYKLHNNINNGYLDVFNRLKVIGKIKGQEADLNRYKSISELGAFVKRFVENMDQEEIWGSNTERKKKNLTDSMKNAADQAKIAYDDGHYMVVIPYTYEASCYWGDGTEWCTAYKDSSRYYDNYSSKGKLYIIIDLARHKKYQFHFETSSFMNEYDESIDLPVFDEFPNSEGLMKFFEKERGKADMMELKYEYLTSDITHPRYIKYGENDDEEYIIDENEKIIAGPFNEVYEYSYGLAKVYTDEDGYNLVDLNGNLRLPKWSNRIVANLGDIIIAEYKYNGARYRNDVASFIYKRDGSLLIDKPFRVVKPVISDNTIIVKNLDGTANLVNITTGEEIYHGDIPLSDCLYFFNGRSIVINWDGKRNLLNTEGELLCDDWYDNIVYEHKWQDSILYAGVYMGDKFNAIDKQGKIVFTEWFDNPIQTFVNRPDISNEPVSINRIDGKRVFLDMDGYIYKSKQFENTSTTKELINEINTKDAYQRFYSMIPEKDYNAIISMLQGDNDVLLSNTKWVLNLYKRKSPRLMEDLYKLHNEKGNGYLDILNRAKERRMLPSFDINKYKSIAELGQFVSTLDVDSILGRTKGEMSNAVHDAKDDIKMLYEDETWKVIVPLSHEASCYWAQGAHWCTATRESDKYYKQYSEQGPLYMNVNLENPKYSTQFHIESEQFMDYYDEELEKPVFDNMPNSKGLANFYKNMLKPENYMDLCAENLSAPNNNRWKMVDEKGSEFMVDENCRQIAGPYQWIQEFHISSGFAKVKKEDGDENVVDENGNEQLENCTYIFRHNDCGILYTYENHKFLFRDGQNISLDKYSTIVPFSGTKLMGVQKDNRLWNIIDENLNEILSEDVKNIKQTYIKDAYYFIVTDQRDLDNVCTTNREFLFDTWYQSVVDMSYTFDIPVFKIVDDDGINFVSLNGKKIFKEGFQAFSFSPMRQLGVVGILTDKNGKKFVVTKDFELRDKNNLGENKLTPNDVKYIVSESAKRLITEISVTDGYNSYYKDIPEEDFNKIVQHLQGNNDVLLPNTKWFLSLYRREYREISNYYLTELMRKPDGKGFLDLYERGVKRGIITGQEANIMNFKTLNDFGKYMNSIIKSKGDEILSRTSGEWSRAVNAAKNDVKKVYEDDEWLILIPLSMDASCYWGNGTHWCTATRNEKENYFERYNNNGELLININKKTREKYQFHIESMSYMNKEDEPISGPILKNIGASEGMMEFYRELTADNFGAQFILFYSNIDDDDWVWSEALQESVAVVYMPNKGYNFYTSSNEFLSETWFDRAFDPEYELPFAKIYENGGYNLFNLKNREIEFQVFNFDSVSDFTIDQDLGIAYARITKNGKHSLIIHSMSDHNYTTWLGRWYDYLEDPETSSAYGLMGVKNDNQWAYINFDGEVIGDWYDGIWDFEGEYAKVCDKGKYNMMDYEGNLVSNTWFDHCGDEVVDDLLDVEINGVECKYNVSTGEIID